MTSCELPVTYSFRGLPENTSYICSTEGCLKHPIFVMPEKLENKPVLSLVGITFHSESFLILSVPFKAKEGQVIEVEMELSLEETTNTSQIFTPESYFTNKENSEGFTILPSQTESIMSSEIRELRCPSPCSRNLTISSVKILSQGKRSLQGVCGSGLRVTGEECDDGNTVSGDGCSSLCEIEPGYICIEGSSSRGDTCTSICGDGIRVGAEQCDDNDTNNGNGCSSSCIVEIGYNCSGGSPTSQDTCSAVCGDGIKLSIEVCDDGNTNSNDGCDSTCSFIEDDYTCAGGSLTSSDTCEVICGNGMLLSNTDPVKFCDDGNTNSGDGCSDNCEVETGWVCTEGNMSAASTCNLCELEFCTKCEDQDHTKCSECEKDTKLNKESLCKRLSKVSMSASGKATASSSQTAASAGGLASVISSVLKLSSPIGIWSMVHQLQVMGLIILTKVFIPDDPKGMLLGEGAGFPFSLSSVRTNGLPGVSLLSEKINLNQTNIELEAIGFQSGSSVVNNLTLILTLLMLMIPHLLLYLLPTFKPTKENQKCRLRIYRLILWLRGFFSFTIYIRTIFESYQYILLSSLATFMRGEINSTESKLSLCFSIAAFFMACCFLQLPLYVSYLSTKQGFDESKRCKEFLVGIRQNNIAKLYAFFGLIRRFLFCVWLVVFSFVGPQILIVGFICIHAPYLGFIIIFRPFADTTNNIVECINELFLTLITIWLCFINKESQWTDTLAKILMNVIFGNIICISVISLTSCIVTVGVFLKGKCCSKKTAPKKKDVKKVPQDVEIHVTQEVEPSQSKSGVQSYASKQNLAPSEKRTPLGWNEREYQNVKRLFGMSTN
ncbi:unnamed protein product [Moneuplotes crassus]|uniref:Uncharacterized protein n=1 Tax=Euplotes crassus TaxID=5936 RepID=A0AAD2CYN9_EUPCR|nr:unnamed protein product [Moneuplotes crassus]